MTDCKDIIWPVLRDASEETVDISREGGACRVTLPFERADKDAITLWIIEEGDNYVITDKGETYGFLYLSNINLDQSRREKRISSTKEYYNLDKAKYEIRMSATKEELGFRMIDAIQAVQSISYLSYTRRQYTQTEFREKVGNYLTDTGYEYETNVPVQGEARDLRVDFQVQNGHPIYMETLHSEDVSTSHDMAQRTAFKWMDISQALDDVTTISVLDDENGEFDEETVRILTTYSDEYLPWSTRGRLTEIIV